MLRNIIVCYVRLLKQKPNSPLLFCALAGLAKFSHLMNLDLVYDLLSYMKKILVGDVDTGLVDPSEYRKELPVCTVLQSLITTAQLMSGLGAAINIDLKEFYNQLYTVIGTCMERSCRELEIRLLLDALYLLLIRTITKLPDIRIAAFVKRITTCAMNVPTHLSIALLAVVQELIIKYPIVREQLLSGEEIGLGTYQAEVDNPDLCNPFATQLWELSTLRAIYHPHTSVMAGNVASQQAVKGHKQITVQDVQAMVGSYNPFLGVFNPAVKPPPANPLQTKLAKVMQGPQQDPEKKVATKKKHDYVFVVPNATYLLRPSAFLTNVNKVLEQQVFVDIE